MSTAIDAAGRLVIPKAVRDAAGLRPGVPLEIRYRDGRIEIEPAPVDVTVRSFGGVAVATPTTDVPVLTTDIIEGVRDGLDRERG